MNRPAEEVINEILTWSLNKKFLPKDLSKPFVYTFLMGCEGNVEKTKEVLENYFYARQSIPEIFTKRDPLLRENLLSWKYSCIIPLKEKQDGCRVFLGSSFCTEHFDFTIFVKQMFMTFDLLIKNNQWGNGDRILIINYDNIRYQNLQSHNIYITRKTVECEGNRYLPGKLRAVHNVHIPPFMKEIHQKFKPFLKAENERLVMFHRHLRSLHHFVNPDILPSELGGAAGPLKILAEKWFEILKANREFFVEEEEKRMRETRVRINLF